MNGFAEPGEPTVDAPGPDLRLQVTRGVLRSFPWVVLLIVIGAGAGILAGMLQPNRYESHAKLFLRMGVRERATTELLVDLDDPQRVPPPTMLDELHMLSDSAIYEKVAREVGPATVLQIEEPSGAVAPQGPLPMRIVHALRAFAHDLTSGLDPQRDEDEVRAATRVLMKNKELENEPGTSVILVKYSSTSPEHARTIVHALLKGFIERHREQFSIHSLLEESRRQLDEARAARDQAAQAFVEKVSQSGIAVLETQVPRAEAEVSALEAELFTAKVRQEEIAKQRASLSNRLEGAPPPPEAVELPMPSVMVPNEEYETQLTLKRTLLADKQQMLIQERPSEERRRRERAFDQQIALLDEKLQSMPKTVPQGSVMAAPSFPIGTSSPQATMESRIVDLEVEEQALPVKVSLIESRLETKRTRLNELQKQLLAATMLRSDLAAARTAEEKRYEALVNRLSGLEALSKIDANEEANLTVMQAPTLEPDAVGPRRGSLFLKGLLGGMLAAAAFAIVRERFDRRLRHPETFQHARGLPVVGVVPHLSLLRQLPARETA